MTPAEQGRSTFLSPASVAVGAWLAAAIGFVALTVLAALYDRFPGDEALADALQATSVPAFGGFLAFVNRVGDSAVFIPVAVALAAGFAFTRRRAEAALLLLVFAPRLLNSLLKALVERPRPSPELVDVTDTSSGFASSFSFPSGHTVGTVTFYALLFFLIPTAVTWPPLRWALQTGCLLMVLAAGPARVYIGVHWPSDVLGGYLVALLFLAPALAAYRARDRRGA